jgi:hypothetical protein
VSFELVTYAAVTPDVRAHAYTVKKGTVREASGACKHPAAIAVNANALGLLFALLAGSRDAHKATARKLARLCVDVSMAHVQ